MLGASLRRPDGTEVWVQALAARVSVDGESLGLVSASDVGARRTAEEGRPARADLLRRQEEQLEHDGVVQPLGSDRPRRTDIRLVCASNADLAEEVRRGAIREDFYHRIMVLAIRVPPLRERLEDIPLLVSHFLRQDPGRLLSLPVGPGRLREEMEKVERAAIETALREHRGEITATWRALGISRRVLYERMKKYGLDKEGFRDGPWRA